MVPTANYLDRITDRKFGVDLDVGHKPAPLALTAKLSDSLCRAEGRAIQILRPRVAPRTILHQFPTVPTFLGCEDKCQRLAILCDGDGFAIR